MNTTNYNFVLPTVGASADQWGTVLNAAIEAVDLQIKVNEDAIGAITPFVPADYVPRAGGSFTGSVTAPNFAGNFSGNATTSTRWATARTLTLTGDATGAVTLDGSSNVTLDVTAAVSSGASTIAEVTGLQAALDAKQDNLAATQTRVITSGTAAAPSSLATGAIYLQHEP